MLLLHRWRTRVPLLSLLFLACGQAATGAPFTPGNVVVYRVGDGSRALASTGNPVFLDEYRPDGQLVQSLPMPTQTNGAHQPFAGGGTATSEGWLTRSENKRCLLVPGYGRDPAITSGNLVSAAGLSRVVGVVAHTGDIDTTTALTDLATGTNNFRGAASTDCTSLWVASSLDGTRAATIGASASVAVAATPAGGRTVAVHDGQLYNASNTGSNTYKGINRIGTGTPATAATATRLPGLTDALTPSPYGFAFADLDGTPGADTLYVADDSVGVTKFSLVAGAWVSNGTVGTGADAYRGLAAVVQGGTVTLYATRNASDLVAWVDASGYNGAFSGTPAVLASAGANQAFRGVAPSPEASVTATASAGLHGTVSPASQTVSYGQPASFSVTPEAGYTAVAGGSCGGTLAGTAYTTPALTADCSVTVTFTQQPTHTVTPTATTGGTIAPDQPRTVIDGDPASFTVTPQPG